MSELLYNGIELFGRMTAAGCDPNATQLRTASRRNSIPERPIRGLGFGSESRVHAVPGGRGP
jgi:hypothetical protein